MLWEIVVEMDIGGCREGGASGVDQLVRAITGCCALYRLFGLSTAKK